MFETNPDITSIIIANVVALFALTTVGLGSSYKLRDGSKESKTLIAMMICIALSSIIDPIVFLIDGNTIYNGEKIIKNTNQFFIFLNHFGNGAMYFLSTSITIAWSIFLVIHLLNDISRKRIIGYCIMIGICIIALFVNIFVPFVFTIDENCVYKRVGNGLGGFLVFNVIDALILLESIIFFIRARRKGGILKFFPIWVFIVPAAMGIIAQGVYYGISTVSIGFTLAVCGMLMSVQSDLISFDKLTGLYNRYYLDQLKKKMSKSRKNAEYTAMMLDLNGFKKINDKYGHSVGDEALITTGSLLRKAVGFYGTVIRYAGDEFVIVLNTQMDFVVQEVVNNIQREFESYNNLKMVPYKLSISIGFSKADFKKYTIDELMSEIDKKMYEDKDRQHSLEEKEA